MVDARRGIIPDPVNAAIAALGCVQSALLGWDVLVWRLFDAALVALLLLALRAYYRRRRGLVGLGLGDVKLLAAATVWLGMASIFVALFLACLGGLGYLGLKVLAGHEVHARTRLRFGPFLAISIGLTGAIEWLFPN